MATSIESQKVAGGIEAHVSLQFVVLGSYTR